MKRFFVMLLACLMLLSVVPFSVFAEEADHEHVEGTEQCPGKDVDHTLENATSWTKLEEVEGSCGGYSYTVYQCNVCDEHFADNFVKTANDSHKWEVTSEKVEPTCTETGREAVETCSHCGATQGGEVIPAEHNYVDGTCTGCGAVQDTDCVHENLDAESATLIQAPTCGEDGKMQYVCADCDAIVVVVVEALGHDEDNLVAADEVKADCVNDGIKAHDTCTECGKFFINGEEVTAEDLVIEALGHDMNDAVVTKEATCDEKGLKVATCKRCDYTVEEEIDFAHDWITEEGTEAGATCTRPGISYAVCSICGATGSLTTTPALGHKVPAREEWTNNYTDEEFENATCDTELTATYFCENCKENITVVVKAKKAHTFVEKSQDATCSTYGKVWDECSVCGAIANEEVLVEEGFNADEHNWTKFWLNRPTCTDKGNWTWICSVHTEVFKDKILHEVPSLHDDEDVSNWVVIGETPATCDEEGSIIYECNVCGEIKTEKVEALGHTFDDGVYFHETCVNDAYTRYTCTVCGETKDEVIVDSHFGFDFTETFNTLEEAQDAHGLQSVLTPTNHYVGSCTEKGVMVYNCSSCGKNVLVFEAGTGEGHVRPEGGYVCTDAFNCAVCGELVEGGKHTGETVIVAPTCTKKGASYCTDCHTLYETTKHEGLVSVELLLGKKATCTETGLTTGGKCSVCGEIVVEQEVIPMLPHNYANVNAELSVDADCEVDGYNFMECADCGARLITDYEFASGHWYIDEENDVKVELVPDCDAECICGAEDEADCVCRVCAYCGETIEKHSYAEPNVVLPTCTEEGYTIVVCTECGHYIIDETSIVEPLGHDFVAVEGSIPATYKPGYIYGVCSICGENAEAELDAAFDMGLTIEIDNAAYAGAGFSDSSLVAVKINLNSIKEVGVWSINFNLNYNSDKFTYVDTEFDAEVFNGFTKAVDNGTFVAIGATTANDENKQLANTIVNAEDVAFVTVYFLVNDQIADNVIVTEEVVNAEGEIVVIEKVVTEDVIANPFTVDATFALNKDFEEVTVWGQTETEITIEKFMDYNKDGVVNAIDYKFAWEIINGTIDTTYDVTLDVDKDGQILENDFFAIFSYILGDADYAYEVLVDRVVEAA